MIGRGGRGHHPFVMRAGPLADGRFSAAESLEARVRGLIDAHFDFIWRLLRRQGLDPADADDAAQQVFMIATQKLDSIDAGSERTFLYGTALRVAANARRGLSRRREVTADGVEDRVAETAGPDDHTELRRAWALLDEILAALPGELARVLSLAEIEQVEVPEIAVLEGIPAGTAASRLRRARAAFRELLAARADRNPFSSGDP